MFPGTYKKLYHQEHEGKSCKILEPLGKLGKNAGFKLCLLQLFKFIDQTVYPVTGNVGSVTSPGHFYQQFLIQLADNHLAIPVTPGGTASRSGS